ncbi:hypothetical protein [Nocardioides sp. SYSU DS0651]|uniref:hypothetical protein n=1 Tax=Nocardioides sp. SYSU DS0651 TaxID=3415955 RepID=UPI003F4C1CF9
MNDTLEDRLGDRLHRLASEVEVPGFAPGDDVRRGRGRLRRNQALAAAGSVVTVAALAGAATTLGGAPAGEEQAATTPAAEQRQRPAAPKAAEAPGRTPVGTLEQRLGEVATDDEGSGQLAQLQAVAAALDDQLGDQPWVRLGMGAAPTWEETGAADCPTGWTCEDVAVEGASRARLATKAGVSQVAAEFPGQVVVVTVTTWDRPADHAYTGTTGTDEYFAIRGD